MQKGQIRRGSEYTCGHDKGDLVLEEIGSMLIHYVREHELASRYGGDEFCLWIARKGGMQEIAQEAERLMRSAAEHQISVSLGIAVVRTDESS